MAVLIGEFLELLVVKAHGKFKLLNVDKVSSMVVNQLEHA
jgi:hypothetical protein